MARKKKSVVDIRDIKIKLAPDGDASETSIGNTPTEDTSNEPLPVKQIPTSEKYTLTIQEASQYFSIGVKKLRRLAEDNLDGYAVCNGNRLLIIRPKFEVHLCKASEI